MVEASTAKSNSAPASSLLTPVDAKTSANKSGSITGMQSGQPMPRIKIKTRREKEMERKAATIVRELTREVAGLKAQLGQATGRDNHSLGQVIMTRDHAVGLIENSRHTAR